MYAADRGWRRLLDTSVVDSTCRASDQPDEVGLVRRAQRGDAAAYETLVRRYQEIAFRTAYLITGDAHDAEDAAQTGFIKAWTALDRFEPDPTQRQNAGRRTRALLESVPHPAPFRPWLLQIVANEARNRRTNRGRHPTLALSDIDDRPDTHPEEAPEAAALAAERDETLLAALNSLSPDDRRVIACRYVLELSEAETADALGIPAGTVKSRLFRALRRARALLGSEGNDPHAS